MVNVFFKSSVIWNGILFIIMSLAFIAIQSLLVEGLNIFSVSDCKYLLTKYFPYILLSLIPIIGLYKYSKWAHFSFIFFTISIFFASVLNVYFVFSKLILVAIFFYVIIAYYYYQFIKLELLESFALPLYDEKLLFEPMSIKIKVEIIDSTGHVVSGILTNWNENGCFISMKSECSIMAKKRIIIKVYFKEQIFVHSGIVVSMLKDKTGLGIKLLDKKQTSESYSWKDFYQLSQNMGLEPGLVK